MVPTLTPLSPFPPIFNSVPVYPAGFVWLPFVFGFLAQWFHLPQGVWHSSGVDGATTRTSIHPQVYLSEMGGSTVYAIPKEVLTKNINWTDELSDWTRLSKWINHLLKSDCESGSCLFKNMVYCTVHPKINWLIIMFATVYCKLPHFLGLCPLFPIFLIH